jgi:MYXO-CTERM domain-containing protein
MKRIHTPVVDASYWLAIALASVSGTNLGDLYAHGSGLGIAAGLALLALLAAAVFLIERRDEKPRLLYYWLAIILIRTGATNIADYAAFRLRVPQALLAIGLLAVIALGAGLSRRGEVGEGGARPASTNGFYWMAMLGAGIFGTVVGDVCSHRVGEGPAAVGLTAILLAVLFAGRRHWTETWIYWGAVAVARTAGTAIGDWLAENRLLNIGLPVSTLATTLAFLLVVATRERALQRPARA